MIIHDKTAPFSHVCVPVDQQGQGIDENLFMKLDPSPFYFLLFPLQDASVKLTLPSFPETQA